MRSLRRKASSQPALLSLRDSDVLEVSRRTTSMARRRSTAMLPGPLSLWLRAASSRNYTSSCQCSAFSMAQWARTVASKISGVGCQDKAKNRVSEVTLSSTSRVASMRLKPLRPGNSWYWECPELCVSELAHAGFRYGHALKRSSNMIAN